MHPAMGRRAPLLVMLSFALSPLCAVVAISVTVHTSSSLCANRHLGLGAYSNTFGGRPRGNTAVALATERREEPPHVMFICKANSCRSQMAHGFMDQLSAGKIVSQSSGCISASVVNKKAVQVMDEIGIDLSAYGSNGLDEYDPFAKPYDAVVCLCGCKDLVPESWQSTAGEERFFDWDVDDPPELDPGDLSVYRRVRDELKDRVANLFDDIATRNRDGMYRAA